jgi:hypothetical protein
LCCTAFLASVSECLLCRARTASSRIHRRRPLQQHMQWVNFGILWLAASILPALNWLSLTYTSGFTRSCNYPNVLFSWFRLTGHVDRFPSKTLSFILYTTSWMPLVEKMFISVPRAKSPLFDSWLLGWERGAFNWPTFP